MPISRRTPRIPSFQVADSARLAANHDVVSKVLTKTADLEADVPSLLDVAQGQPVFKAHGVSDPLRAIIFGRHAGFGRIRRL